MKLSYLGHSAFEIVTQSHKILIDPFLVMAPDYDYSGVEDIFVTHGHGDHLGKAPQIALKTGAVITACFELAKYCARYEAVVNGISLGAWINYPWGRVIAVPAFHSSSSDEGVYTGCPMGFVFDIEGKKIYHAGDTCLNSEMKVIGELYHPDCSMLPVGGQFTMDVEHALIASLWTKSKSVIPMHYNTFPKIETNIQEFSDGLIKSGIKPIILKPEESIEL